MAQGAHAQLNYSGYLVYLFLFIQFRINATVGSVSPLQTWELSDTSLNGATRYASSVYNGNSNYPECIFVFGGTTVPDADKNKLLCYNIENGELSEFKSLDTSLADDRWTGCEQGAFIISDGNDDTLYYADQNGNVYTLDLNDESSTEDLKISTGITYPCLLKHPDDTEFYVIDGFKGNEFYVFDLTDDLLYTGNSLNVVRILPATIINEYDDNQGVLINKDM